MLVLGIRSSIDKSHNVTYFDLMTVQPFENVLLKVPVNGKSLLDAFEHSVKKYVQMENQNFIA